MNYLKIFEPKLMFATLIICRLVMELGWESVAASYMKKRRREQETRSSNTGLSGDGVWLFVIAKSEQKWNKRAWLCVRDLSRFFNVLLVLVALVEVDQTNTLFSIFTLSLHLLFVSIFEGFPFYNKKKKQQQNTNSDLQNRSSICNREIPQARLDVFV